LRKISASPADVRIGGKFLKEETVKSTRIFTLLLTIGLVAAFCLQAMPAVASAQETFQRALQVTGPVSIDLSPGSGSVNVRSGNSGQVLVTGRVRVTNWFGGDAQQVTKRIIDNPPIQQSGNDIRIGHLTDSELLHNVSISYDLVVPAETHFRSHTGSGSQNLAAASFGAVFLMLIVNLILFRRTHAGRTATA
jgi:hypothetical protein